MAGFQDNNTANLLRTNLWSRQIKELLLDELNAMKFVRIIQDFPDGVQINIPSIGEAETADFTEGQAIKYNAMDKFIKRTSVHLKLDYMLETPKSLAPQMWNSSKDWTISRKGKYDNSNRGRTRLVRRHVGGRGLCNLLQAA
jgi:hypothetical protein